MTIPHLSRLRRRAAIVPIVGTAALLFAIPVPGARAGEPIVRPICFPVTEAVTYIDDFGFPRPGGRTRRRGAR